MMEVDALQFEGTAVEDEAFVRIESERPDSEGGPVVILGPAVGRDPRDRPIKGGGVDVPDHGVLDLDLLDEARAPAAADLLRADGAAGCLSVRPDDTGGQLHLARRVTVVVDFGLNLNCGFCLRRAYG